MSKVTSEHQLSVSFSLPPVCCRSVAPSVTIGRTGAQTVGENWTIVVNEALAEEIAATLEGVALKLREFVKKREGTP